MGVSFFEHMLRFVKNAEELQFPASRGMIFGICPDQDGGLNAHWM
jgi:hypothetical protein